MSNLIQIKESETEKYLEPWKKYAYLDVDVGKVFGDGFDAAIALSEQNAHLIAAAPEMLQALEIIEGHVKKFQDHYSAIGMMNLDKLIKKAKVQDE